MRRAARRPAALIKVVGRILKHLATQVTVPPAFTGALAAYARVHPDADLLAYLDVSTLTGTPDAPQDAVTLCTMHGAKGLEFDAVVVAGVEVGLMPSARAPNPHGIDEERRLLYVAMTRAHRRLVLTHTRWRRQRGQLQPTGPSPFLDDLPAEIVREKP